MIGTANPEMYGVLQASATLRSKCVEHHTYKMKDIRGSAVYKYNHVMPSCMVQANDREIQPTFLQTSVTSNYFTYSSFTAMCWFQLRKV